MTDTRILLPHPVRNAIIDNDEKRLAAFARHYNRKVTSFIDATNELLLGELWPYLRDALIRNPELPHNLILGMLLATEVPQVHGKIRQLEAAINKYSTGNANLGGVNSALLATRAKSGFFTHIQTTDDLEERLRHTDIGKDTPMSMFMLPYRACYIEFGEHRYRSPYKVPNDETGLHSLEGAYVHECTIEDPKSGLPIRAISISLIGSPHADSTDLGDDAVQTHMIMVRDEALSVEESIYACMKESTESGRFSRVLREQEKDSYNHIDYAVDCIGHLAKVLLYLGCEGIRKESRTERTDFAKKLAMKGSKKAAKLANKIHVLSDRIIVSAPSSTSAADPGFHAEYRGVTAHWRRGHFRQQVHGEGRALRKLLWIEPVLVNRELLASTDTSTKRYTVK